MATAIGRDFIADPRPDGLIYSEDAINSAEDDWATRAATATVFAENYSTYADRGEWMAALAAEGSMPSQTGGAAKFAYWPIDIFSDDWHADPVPGGTIEKTGFSFTNFLTGGKAAYLRRHPVESTTNAGPTVEMRIPDLNVYYVQVVVRFDSAFLDHDHWTSGFRGMKLIFLNELSFANGQVLQQLFWRYMPGLSRVPGGSMRQCMLDVNAGPANGQVQKWPFWDDLTPASPSTLSEYRQRYGYTENNEGTPVDFSNPDYDDVIRLEADKWYVTTAYVDQDYVGPLDRGILKLWFSEYGQPPRLTSGSMLDCGLNQIPRESIRLALRPEDSNVPMLDSGGVYFDQVLVSQNPIDHPGGFALPYPGTDLPPNYPPPDTTEVS